MFKLNVDNKELKVVFRYGMEKVQRKNKRYTECMLFEYTGEVNSRKTYRELASYKEFCSPLDNFDKNTGRKLALANLLKQLNYSRGVRILFWDAYFKASGKKGLVAFSWVTGM